jgi:DNA-binding beta-propeller fold protein YncE
LYPYGICIAADGVSVYTANLGNATVGIYTRNTGTGALSGTSTIAAGDEPFGICIAADGTNVYSTGSGSGSNKVHIFTRS